MQKLKHLLSVVLVTLLVAVGLVSVAAQDDAVPAHVVLYVEGPLNFDAAVEGFQAELEALDYVAGETVMYTIANDAEALTAALETGATLVVSFPGDAVFDAGVDLGDTPVIFVGARLLPDGAGTGVLQPDVTFERLALALNLVPDADTIYVAYDSTPHLPEMALTTVAEVIEERGLDLAIADVAFDDAEAVATAIDAIPAEADMIFIVTPAAAPVGAEWSAAAFDRGVPLVLEYAAEFPVLMTYGADFAAMGAQAGSLAYAVLGGVSPGVLQVMVAAPVLTINTVLADQIGVAIPDELLNLAVLVDVVNEAAGAAPDDAPAAELGACQATLTHPGGTNAICMNVSCDVPLDSAFIQYVDRVPVESCTDEGLIGTCEMEAFTMFHYDGAVDAVARGCVMLMGTWAEVGGDAAADEPADEPAAEPTAEPAADDAGANADAALGACMATLKHPAGTNAICVDVACDVPLDSAVVSYLDRVPVEVCPDEGLIGTCTMEAFTMFHYDGKVSAVSRGCGALGGEWAAP